LGCRGSTDAERVSERSLAQSGPIAVGVAYSGSTSAAERGGRRHALADQHAATVRPLLWHTPTKTSLRTANEAMPLTHDSVKTDFSSRAQKSKPDPKCCLWVFERAVQLGRCRKRLRRRALCRFVQVSAAHHLRGAAPIQSETWSHPMNAVATLVDHNIALPRQSHACARFPVAPSSEVRGCPRLPREAAAERSRPHSLLEGVTLCRAPLKSPHLGFPAGSAYRKRPPSQHDGAVGY
jgi:hypothetical protein